MSTEASGGGSAAESETSGLREGRETRRSAVTPVSARHLRPGMRGLEYMWRRQHTSEFNELRLPRI